VTDNGIFRPFALVNGRAVAVWKLQGGRVLLEPFRKVARRDEAALRGDAERVLAFLGLQS
jgi:hypothetical protein